MILLSTHKTRAHKNLQDFPFSNWSLGFKLSFQLNKILGLPLKNLSLPSEYARDLMNVLSGAERAAEEHLSKVRKLQKIQYEPHSRRK